jgi:hypothetical protein
MLIKGEAYEFVKKYVFTPSEPVKPISTFAEPKGVQTIIVKYIVPVPSIPPEILNILSKYIDVEHYIAYLYSIAYPIKHGGNTHQKERLKQKTRPQHYGWLKWSDTTQEDAG